MIQIRPAIEHYLTSQPNRKERPSELYVSELGYHPQKFLNRVLHGKTEPFDAPTLDIMQQGSVLEADTVAALQLAHANVRTQFPLYNATWSGYADIVIGHGTEDVTIIEHKCTGQKWFDYKKSLPRSTHICQLWMYGWLYEQMYGIRPNLKLYYRSWGSFAEFALPAEPLDDGAIAVTGCLGDKVRGQGFVVAPVTRLRYIAPNLLRLEAEQLFGSLEQFDSETIDPETWTYPEDAYVHLVENLGDEPIW